jgi:recombination protein RecA
MTKKKSDDGTTTLAAIIAAENENLGAGTMFYGTGLKKDPDRVPFGVFAVDYATGGGVPVYTSCCLWGPEAGGKSSLAANILAMGQSICWKCFSLLPFCKCSRSPLKLDGVWLDIEGTLDRTWVTNIGADPERYVCVIADYGEQYVNIGKNVLKADDCGILVVDSLAALVPESEYDAPAEQDFYALQARLIGKMIRKFKQQLMRERKREHPCIVIFINQMRTKIGVTFGSPETMPGGWGLRHENSLLLRCVKKVLDASADRKYKGDKSTDRDKAVRHAFSIKKEKVLTLAGSGEFVRIREEMPDLGLKPGMIGDHRTVLNYAKEFGVIEKVSGAKPWKYGKLNARTLDQIVELWVKKPEYYYKAQMDIIRAAKNRLREESGEQDV